MPLIISTPYHKPAAVASFDVTKYTLVNNSLIHGMFGFSGGKFYDFETGGTYVATDGVAGFSKTANIPLTYANAFAKNESTGRIFMSFSSNSQSASNGYYSDNDGASWTARPFPVSEQYVAAASNNNGVVIMTGTANNGTPGTRTVRSTDNGFTWSNITTAASGGDFIKYFPRLGIFVLANQNQVRTSSDGGVTWNTFKTTISGANHVTNIVDDGTKLVLFNYSQTAPVMTSTDGYNWSAPAISITWANASNPYDAEYGNGLYMMVSNSRYIYTSTDLVNWQTSTHPTNTSLQTTTYGNGQFILTTNGGGYYVYYY